MAPEERAALAAWIAPAQLELFDSMHVADRRHGLDVVASLRAEGVTEPDLLVAGLAPRRRQGRHRRLAARRVHAWGAGTAPGSRDVASVLPGFRPALERLRTHAETSAALAAAAGCSPRTVELIRNQDAPLDPEFGELLRLADEAN